jgi:cytidyltransferase-like protein
MNDKTEKVKLDRKTEEWFEKHPEVNITVALCQDCGLYYKPSLGHSCKRQNKKIQNGVHECGLYVGRFQPLHIGHTSIIDKMLDECSTIIVAVGSAQESGTVRNPLSFEFRKRLIETVYEDYIDRITILPINDRVNYSDDSSWGNYLFQQIKKQCDLSPTIIYEGEEDVRSHWYDNCDVPVVKVSRAKLPINGTVLRSAIVENCKNFVLTYLPNKLYPYYEEIRKEIQNATTDKKCN